MTAPSPDRHRRGTLGTFAGVFTPSILTILGIILFLRMGFVVGNAGLAGTLVIVGIATAVSVLTSTSLAAIATNIDVRGGGDYYLISRTLGVEFGGAIGVVLFLAQSVSIAFYTIGFGEVTAAVLGIDSTLAVQFIALVAIAVLFGFAWAGADVATRFQYVVMALLILALLAFFAGAFGAFDAGTLDRNMSSAPEGLGFWAVFAIFFPAVTGFTQGVSMSGDLADPARSLPRGTFVAVALSTVVYVAVAILIAAGAPQADLVDDGGEAMRRIALIGPLVLLGVFAATLSSAMASFLGAPRILQSLAADRVFPFLTFFAKGHGPHANPRRAVLLSLVIAVVTLSLGALNAIAAVVSMFFLISYGMLNYATYWEARAKSPSFRPRFRFFDKRLSLAGAAACLGAMLAIDVVAGGAALAVLFALYQYLTRRRTPDRWADAASSHHFQRAKEAIRALTDEEPHARNWRPQILAFSADSERRERLLRFAAWLEGGSGLTAVINVVRGEGLRMRQECNAQQEAMERQVEAMGLDVYPRAVLAPSGMDALPVVVQAFGLGRIGANTALFGWPEDADAERMAGYRRALRDVARLGVNVVAMASDQRRWEATAAIPRRERRIDVWWSDDDSGRLALLAAYLVTRTPEWGRARIRLLAPAPAADHEQVAAELAEMVDGARIDAEVVVFVEARHGDVYEACAGAGLVFMPMRVREEVTLDVTGGDLADLLTRLPLAAVVLAAQPIDLLAGPESGPQLSLVEAEDAADQAAARLSALLKRLAAIDAEVEAAWADEDHQAALEREREDVARRVIKARARLATAKAEVAALLEERT